MLIRREKRYIAFVLKAALLIALGTVLFLPKIELGSDSLVANAEVTETSAS